MRKTSRKSAKVFHEKDAMLIAEKVCVLKQFVGDWWEEWVDLTLCNETLRGTLVKLATKMHSIFSKLLSSEAFVRFPNV